MVAPHICCFCIYAQPKMWHHSASVFVKKIGILQKSTKNRPIMPQLKNVFKKPKPCIILVLDAFFVLNFTFLGLLSPEILFGEKSVTHTAYSATSEPQCSTLKNILLLHTIQHHVHCHVHAENDMQCIGSKFLVYLIKFITSNIIDYYSRLHRQYH